MSERPGSHLDPVVLARIGNLQLRARTVVEGFVAGLHQSPYRGHSLEFAQHREYAIGDELRHIDWKVYGRTDRFFVKQFEEETNLRLQVLLDSSGSMGFRGNRSALSKYDYGATLAASLAYLALRQGDSVGLSALSSSSGAAVPPRSSLSHLNILLDELGRIRPAGKTNLAAGLESFARSLKKRSLIVLISDFLDAPEPVIQSLRFLSFKKHEAVVVHLMDPDEREFPYDGLIRFESMEDDSTLTLEAGELRDEYRRTVDRLIASYRAAMRAAGMDYVLCSTDEPMDRVLSRILKRSNG